MVHSDWPKAKRKYIIAPLKALCCMLLIVLSGPSIIKKKKKNPGSNLLFMKIIVFTISYFSFHATVNAKLITLIIKFKGYNC